MRGLKICNLFDAASPIRCASICFAMGFRHYTRLLKIKIVVLAVADPVDMADQVLDPGEDLDISPYCSLSAAEAASTARKYSTRAIFSQEAFCCPLLGSYNVV